MIHHGDCLEVMAGMEPESVDAIVTDPPYGLEFMGQGWDKLTTHGFTDGADRRPSPSWSRGSWQNKRCRKCGHIASGGSPCRCDEPEWEIEIGKSTASARASQAWHQQWAEAAFRVAKPSAYLLAFGGTRTVHRMTVALEDAGWIIRDLLVWGYASGFPKSKASLKPAWEPIVMARKPGPLRELAIDACRIGEPEERRLNSNPGMVGGRFGAGEYEPNSHETRQVIAGRWPANLVLTDPIFDGGIEGVVGGGEANTGALKPYVEQTDSTIYGGGKGYRTPGSTRTVERGSDSGTYSRFFILPKADRADREPVLGGLPKQDDDVDGSFGLDAAGPHTKPDYVYQRKPRANVHPTVKPTELMRHLVRLVTPPGGLVLDPFLGSGTTGLACELEGFPWVGIERETEYVAIAEARLNGTQKGMGLAV